MKSETSQSFAAWLRRIRLKIQFQGRPGKCLLRAVSKAKRADRAGQDFQTRQILSDATFAIDSIKDSGPSFARHWQALLRFQLAVFDLPGAEETARRATQLKLPD